MHDISVLIFIQLMRLPGDHSRRLCFVSVSFVAELLPAVSGRCKVQFDLTVLNFLKILFCGTNQIAFIFYHEASNQSDVRGRGLRNVDLFISLTQKCLISFYHVLNSFKVIGIFFSINTDISRLFNTPIFYLLFINEYPLRHPSFKLHQFSHEKTLISFTRTIRSLFKRTAAIFNVALTIRRK